MENAPEFNHPQRNLESSKSMALGAVVMTTTFPRAWAKSIRQNLPIAINISRGAESRQRRVNYCHFPARDSIMGIRAIWKISRGIRELHGGANRIPPVKITFLAGSIVGFEWCHHSFSSLLTLVRNIAAHPAPAPAPPHRQAESMQKYTALDFSPSLAPSNLYFAFHTRLPPHPWRRIYVPVAVVQV